jgi:hypothetical protein
MIEEMAALDKNEAWDLVDFPTRRNFIGKKWVFKKNLNEKGKVETQSSISRKRLFSCRGN